MIYFQEGSGWGGRRKQICKMLLIGILGESYMEGQVTILTICRLESFHNKWEETEYRLSF